MVLVIQCVCLPNQKFCERRNWYPRRNAYIWHVWLEIACFEVLFAVNASRNLDGGHIVLHILRLFNFAGSFADLLCFLVLVIHFVVLVPQSVILVLIYIFIIFRLLALLYPFVLAKVERLVIGDVKAILRLFLLLVNSLFVCWLVVIFFLSLLQWLLFCLCLFLVFCSLIFALLDFASCAFLARFRFILFLPVLFLLIFRDGLFALLLFLFFLLRLFLILFIVIIFWSVGFLHPMLCGVFDLLSCFLLLLQNLLRLGQLRLSCPRPDQLVFLDLLFDSLALFCERALEVLLPLNFPEIHLELVLFEWNVGPVLKLLFTLLLLDQEFDFFSADLLNAWHFRVRPAHLYNKSVMLRLFRQFLLGGLRRAHTQLLRPSDYHVTQLFGRKNNYNQLEVNCSLWKWIFFF